MPNHNCLIAQFRLKLLGESYAKCKKVQCYYIMKVGHLSRCVQWSFVGLSLLGKKNKPTMEVIMQQKNPCLNLMVLQPFCDTFGLTMSK